MAKNEGAGLVTITVSGASKKRSKEKRLGPEQELVAKAVATQEKKATQLLEMSEDVRQAIENQATTENQATAAQLIEEWKSWLASVRFSASAVRAASESLQKVEDGQAGNLMKAFEMVSRKEVEGLKRDVEQLKSKMRRLLK